jgi:succinoglycan biosynthesis transport protein ExoP
MATHDGTTYGFDEPGDHYSMRDLLTIVFKRHKLILVFAFVVVSVVMLVTVLMPRTYEVTATLLVNKARAEIPIAPTDAPQYLVSQVTEQDLNSEIEVLKSRQRIEDVVKTIGDEGGMSDQTPNLMSTAVSWLKRILGAPRLSALDAVVVDLSREIKVFSVRKSNVIRISYESKDPEWATRVVSTLTTRYLERRAERFQSPQAVSFFSEQMQAAEQRLEEQERALEDFVEEASITMVKGPQGSDSLASQKALVMGRLGKLENDLGDAEALMREQEYEASSLRQRIAEEPERLVSSSRFNQDAATEEIEKGLAALRLQRDALLQDFRPDSRHVRDIDTQIKLAEERLRRAQDEGGGVDGTEINPVYLELRSQLLRTEADLDGTRARVMSLRSQVARHKRELEILNAQAFKLDRLSRDAEAAEEDYLLYRKKHEEARISAAMDQEKFINVTVAQPAQMPLKPVSRGLVMKFLLAMIVGVLGGLGLAFGLENYLDRSFTTGEDIERKLGVPHIASIPEGEMAG